MVAVDANRTNGIQQLLSQQITPEIILLDDAYQHRKVKAGFYILLTAYDELFSDDFILPFGNLRESAIGKKRAKEMWYSNPKISPQQAVDMGLINRVMPDAELDAEVDALAARLASLPPLGLAAIKSIVTAAEAIEASSPPSLKPSLPCSPITCCVPWAGSCTSPDR